MDGTEESGCFDGDEISDTPITTGPHYGCNLQTEECDGVTAMVQNFMDYSDDTWYVVLVCGVCCCSTFFFQVCCSSIHLFCYYNGGVVWYGPVVRNIICLTPLCLLYK